ncbi:carbonic anhydrase [Halteromyces radiatus]|uniref:carbonic anhydrase n=1 Tax=Halteromyces radiatus TaxID=101107 RepID=UPI0022201F99|nr:carbonic anhydrase [Halteromyces radiatus]KAI8099983.1 carbonic anhydrase [Halteromyces radiatus]
MLSVHDIRKLDKKVATCILDDELLSLTTIKHDHQVVVGSQSGALYFWEWGEWTKVKDKWVGHPSSVDTLCKLDEDTICTGGNDGLLRLVSVSPQYQFEGIIGDHGEDFPVERVRLSHDGPLLDEESSPICLLGSCGHDMQLRFWDIGYLYGPDSDQSDDGTENDDRNNDSTSTKKRHDSSSSPKTTTMAHAKFDSSDVNLDGLLAKNHAWAKSITDEDPNFFKKMALGQSPKILWIGCSDSRVPANQVLQLGPGEIFVHRNIANVVTHTDMSCLSVLQYSIEVLKIEHVIVCGHYNCGGVATAYSRKQVGLIDNWLRNIKDVYRLNESKVNSEKEESERLRRLVEFNAIHSAQNVCYSTIVQDAWKRGQKLTVHAWVHDINDG